MTDSGTNPRRTRAADPYGYETWGEKFNRKFKENPWVPLGCLATVGALVMSAVKMRAGKSKEMNYWMRARVGLQGVTLVALVAGSMALQAKRDREAGAVGIDQGLPRNETDQELTREQIKQQEKEKFEERLRNAEAAHSQEVAFAASAASKAATSAPQAGAAPPPSTPSRSSKSWWKVW